MIKHAHKYKTYKIVFVSNDSVSISAWSFKIGWRWLKFYDKGGDVMHAIRNNICYSICLTAALKSTDDTTEQDKEQVE